MPILTKTKITEAQRRWLVAYEEETGFEPIAQDDLDGTKASFVAVADKNLRWYESHTQDTYHRISHALGKLR